MGFFGRLAREPLVQFLAIGAVLFAIASVLKPPPEDERKIVVDRNALLEFIQYRSKAFEGATANEILDGLKPGELKSVVDDYINEQVSYREAKKLNLESDDYVVKQRLIQKFDFLQETLVGEPAPTEKEIVGWYETHKGDYVEPATVTFTHVYFAREKRGDAAAEARAEETALEFLKKKAPFEAAPGRGDRFPFGVNFVDRTFADVASQFGDAAAEKIFSVDGPFNSWRGPLRSMYGAHAVYVKKLTLERTPPLAEVRNKVIEDVSLDIKARAKAGLLEGARKRYQVIVDLPQEAPAISP